MPSFYNYLFLSGFMVIWMLVDSILKYSMFIHQANVVNILKSIIILVFFLLIIPELGFYHILLKWFPHIVLLIFAFYVLGLYFKHKNLELLYPPGKLKFYHSEVNLLNSRHPSVVPAHTRDFNFILSPVHGSTAGLC